MDPLSSSFVPQQPPVPPAAPPTAPPIRLVPPQTLPPKPPAPPPPPTPPKPPAPLAPPISNAPTAESTPLNRFVRTLAGDIMTVEKGGRPDLVPLKKTLPIRTYEGDFSDRVQETGAVRATILASEQDAGPEPSTEPEVESESQKNVLYIIAAIALVIIGGGGAVYAYMRYLAASAPVLSPATQTPIFVDEGEKIFGSGTLLLQAIEQSNTRPLAPHAVRAIYTASSTMPDSDIFSILPISAPDILRRNIIAAGSMAGIVNSGVSGGPGTGGSQSPFFILAVSAYKDTFAGMLSWESTMPGNLALLFPPYSSGTSSTISTTTQTTSTTTVQKTASTTPPVSGAVPAGWHDEVANNHDVRVYRDALGRSVITYGYWNQSSLIIARDPAAFIEIIGRLATARPQL